MAASNIEDLISAIATRQDNQIVFNIINQLPDADLIKRDVGGKTAMHHAIAQANPAVIEALKEKNYKTLLQNSKTGFISEISPLAFAMQRYNDAPSIVALSLVNQIYFSLSKTRNNNDRCKALDQRADVVGGHIFYASRVWEHGLYLCFERDISNEITGINMDWIDIVVSAINDGLKVLGGIRVNKQLLIYYAGDVYGSNAGDLISRAINSQNARLAERTVAQTQVNKTLTKSAEFMQRTKMVLPTLYKLDASRELGSNKIERNSLIQQVKPTNEVSYYFKDKDGKITLLESCDFSEEKNANLTRTAEIFAAMTMNKSRKASIDEVPYIMNILPVQTIPVASSAATSQPRKNLRGVISKTPQALFTVPEREPMDDADPAAPAACSSTEIFGAHP